MVQNVFRTGFLVRAAHTLLTWVITLILFVHNTGFRPGDRVYDASDFHGSSTTLWLLPAAAANESQALPDLQKMRAALRPPLSVDGELRGREEPSLVPALPAGAAAGAAVGAASGLVGHLSRRHVGVLVAGQRLPAGGAVRGGRLLGGGGGAAGLPRLPGVHQLHHLGVHVPPQDRLPAGAPGPGQPLRPRRPLQPKGLLLRVRRRGVGAGLPREHPEPRLRRHAGVVGGACRSRKHFLD
ncbi:uncharacterized protein LOC133632628 isoform X2 [Entelurus aequoreus]|uniref:uncharacterized protein LOC133632628 isoform X2 n=1 Tax=Entelurus aequoreus TaxID=161455 RepID=UPI002B1DCE6C|nr:uncharacterized protein LOC133632628 isoform X2 [Entelurus aequoreus]